MPRQKRFIIADPSLVDWMGHFFHYDEAVAQQARVYGYDPIVLSRAKLGTELNEQASIRIVPTFRHGLERSTLPLGLIRWFDWAQNWDVRENSADLLRDLLRCSYTTADIQSDDFVLFHTVTYRQLPGLAKWWRGIPRKRRPRLGVILRYAPAYDPFDPNGFEVALYRRGLEELALSDESCSRLTLYCDSERLKDEYEVLTSLPIKVAPIPHTNVAPPKPAPELLLTYLGNARSSKGYYLLPGLVRLLLADERWRDRVKFEFQSNLMFTQDEESARAVELLSNSERVHPTRIVLHKKNLSQTEYADVLSRSRLLLIPYQLRWYYAQTSGILSEAFASGIPVVAPRGTWMAEQVRRSGGAGELFVADDPKSFGESVIRALEQIDTLARRAQDYRAAWIATHNSQAFMKVLLSGDRP